MRRGLDIFTASSCLLLAGSMLGLSGCTQREVAQRTPNIGSIASASVTPAAGGGFVPERAQEPSAVWADRHTLVIGYNDEDENLPPTPGFMGWAYSTNNGVNFTKCNVSNPVNCNGGAVDVSAITGFRSFLRHPALATDGNGNVLYATLVDTDGDRSTAERVVVVLSTDFGHTFRRAFPVNEDSCSNGSQDMPHIAFDYTTSPATFWVVWRHNGSGASFGGCIRRSFIDTPGGTPTITFLDTAHDVNGMDRQGGASVARAASKYRPAMASSASSSSTRTTSPLARIRTRKTKPGGRSPPSTTASTGSTGPKFSSPISFVRAWLAAPRVYKTRSAPSTSPAVPPVCTTWS